jgi:Flp pilus assembly pilin Flp
MLTAALHNFLKTMSGATSIEYGLIAALVSVASIVALQTLSAACVFPWEPIRRD